MARKQPEVVEMRLEPYPPGEGVASHTTFRTKRGGQGGGPSFEHETEDHHHHTMEHLHAHIDEHLGKAFEGVNGPGKEPDAEGPED